MVQLWPVPRTRPRRKLAALPPTQLPPAPAPNALPSAATRSSRRRSMSSPRAALPRRGSTTWRSAPASPRARSISTSPTRRALFQELIRAELSPVVGGLIQVVACRHPDPAVRPSSGRRLRPRGVRDPPQGRDPAGPHRRAALSQARRVLLPARSSPACWRRSARCCSVRSSVASSSTTRWCDFRSCSRAHARCHHVERAVRPLRAARCPRADARPFRHSIR